MKKVLSVLLTLLLCLSLIAGCGAKEDVADEAADGTDVQAGTDVEQKEESTDPYTEEELWFSRDGLNLYGKLYCPVGEGPYPLVIMAHGLNGSHQQGIGMAKRFALSGVAAYVFDFADGGHVSKSDGESTQMSVLTEAADLVAVLDGFLAMPEIDTENIFLYGASQGGLVATYVAATRPDQVKALVSLFPAYSLPETAATMLADMPDMGDTVDFLGMTVGRCYFDDAAATDIYAMMPNYTNHVLLLHGTADTLIPLSYSQRAAEAFPAVEYTEVEGGTHGNLGAEADERVISFVLEQLG